MREFQERRRFRKLLHSRYVIALLLILCVLLVRAVWGVYGKYEKSKIITDRTETEFLALKAREKSLNQKIVDLNTDLGKEVEIRERFGVVREGERLIVLVDDTSGNKDTFQTPRESWWDKLVGFFRF